MGSLIETGPNYIIFHVTDYMNRFNFPKTLDGLMLKNGEFHVSLLKFPDDLEPELRDKIREITYNYEKAFSENPPALTGQFLGAADNEQDKKSIIGLMDFPDLESWRDAVRAITPNVNFSIPHVTIYFDRYDANGHAGVGLNTKERFDGLTFNLSAETEQVLQNATMIKGGGE